MTEENYWAELLEGMNWTITIEDLKRAEEVGIRGILFKNAKQLKEELEEKYQIQFKGIDRRKLNYTG